MIGLLIGLLGLIVIAGATYRGLRGWRCRRKAAWELERVGWREWITGP
jgi:hypothetical protein